MDIDYIIRNIGVKQKKIKDELLVSTTPLPQWLIDYFGNNKYYTLSFTSNSFVKSFFCGVNKQFIILPDDKKDAKIEELLKELTYNLDASNSKNKILYNLLQSAKDLDHEDIIIQFFSDYFEKHIYIFFVDTKFNNSVRIKLYLSKNINLNEKNALCMYLENGRYHMILNDNGNNFFNYTKLNDEIHTFKECYYNTFILSEGFCKSVKLTLPKIKDLIDKIELDNISSSFVGLSGKKETKKKDHYILDMIIGCHGSKLFE